MDPVAPPIALSEGDVILIVFFLAVPIALLAFAAGAGNAFRQIGRGQFSVEYERDVPGRLRDSGAEDDSGELREAEIRQLLEAKAYRQDARGDAVLDVDAELERLLAESGAPDPAADPALRQEVRQLVIARNQRRARQGKDPLDVDAEVERRLRELGDLS